MFKTIIVSLSIFATFIITTNSAINTKEQRECESWSTSSTHIAQWQVEQCNAHHISLIK